MSTAASNKPAAGKILDLSDPYGLCNHEHLRLVSSSSASSSRSTSATSSHADLIAYVDRKTSSSSDDDLNDSNVSSRTRNSCDCTIVHQDDDVDADAEHLLQRNDVGPIELYRTPRIMKASLARKLMAFTTDSDIIAKVCVFLLSE